MTGFSVGIQVILKTMGTEDYRTDFWEIMLMLFKGDLPSGCCRFLH